MLETKFNGNTIITNWDDATEDVNIFSDDSTNTDNDLEMSGILSDSDILATETTVNLSDGEDGHECTDPPPPPESLRVHEHRYITIDRGETNTMGLVMKFV